MISNMVRSIYNESEMFFQRRTVLIENMCNSFLPVSVYNKNGKENLIVYCEGYKRLSELYDINTEQCFSIIIGIIDKLERGREYLFSPGDFILNINTIYMSLDGNDIRFAFVPERGYISEKAVIFNIINSIKNIADNVAKDYLHILEKQIFSVSITTGKLIALINDIESEYNIVSRN